PMTAEWPRPCCPVDMSGRFGFICIIPQEVIPSAMSKFDDRPLHSHHVTKGAARAPHRAFLRGMGLGDTEINQPFVGIASTWNEATPCNLTLDRQAKAV